jgi:hypothetical protein
MQESSFVPKRVEPPLTEPTPCSCSLIVDTAFQLAHAHMISGEPVVSSWSPSICAMSWSPSIGAMYGVPILRKTAGVTQHPLPAHNTSSSRWAASLPVGLFSSFHPRKLGRRVMSCWPCTQSANTAMAALRTCTRSSFHATCDTFADFR